MYLYGSSFKRMLMLLTTLEYINMGLRNIVDETLIQIDDKKIIGYE
jgi:hypothetical protein